MGKCIFDDVSSSIIVRLNANQHDGALTNISALVPKLKRRFECFVGRTSTWTATRVVSVAKLPTAMDEHLNVAWNDGRSYLPASTLAYLAD